MFTIKELIRVLRSGRVWVTDHADEEAYNDRLTYEDIFGSVVAGEIIEEYPEDRPYPSCLICGNSPKGEPVHSVWAYNGDTQSAVLVTVYRPDPAKWTNWKIRRNR